MKDSLSNLPEKGLDTTNFSMDKLAPTEKEFLDGLKDAIEEVKQIKAGNKVGETFQQFLDDLWPNTISIFTNKMIWFNKFP